MQYTARFNVKRTDGEDVDPEDIAAALAEEFEGHEFEAGDGPSVFEITDADADPVEEG